MQTMSEASAAPAAETSAGETTSAVLDQQCAAA
jgi:hypothetical protein